MEYRREVDGLRALAVVPVILFHAGSETFSGGFVGVDVFFVISGYLITSIVCGEIEAGRFSIARFYERRARRILPALFLVVAVSIPFAWLWLLPEDMAEFSRSVAAVSVFASNVMFWRESGYFDTTAELKPMLHTWSLAVEEQFYVVMPLLLVLAWRLGKRAVVAIVAGIALASFAAACWGAFHAPLANFFLLPTRAWELAVGSLIAFHLARPRKPTLPPVAHELLALAGLALIVHAMLTLSRATPFPSPFALPPTLGAALVILFARPHTLAGRLLGTRALVGIGLVSYSAYLWHHPLFAFARHRSLVEPGPGVLAALSLASLVLAYASWRVVERPFRSADVVGRRTVVALGLAGSLLLLAFGLAGHLSNGFAGRIGEELAAVRAAASDVNPRRRECHAGPARFIEPASACVIGDERNVVGVLLGDSHADAIAHALSTALARAGVGMRNLTYRGCPSVPGLDRIGGGYRCDAYFGRALALVASDPELRTVVLVNRWTIYVESEPFDNGEGGVEDEPPVRMARVVPGGRQPIAGAERRTLLLGRYRELVTGLLRDGKEVILVYPIPEVGWDVPRVLMKQVLFERTAHAQLATDHALFLRRNGETIRGLDAIGSHPRLHRVRPEEILCDTVEPGRCVTQIGGQVLYYDDNHLSNAGAALVVEAIMEHVDAQR